MACNRYDRDFIDRHIGCRRLDYVRSIHIKEAFWICSLQRLSAEWTRCLTKFSHPPTLKGYSFRFSKSKMENSTSNTEFRYKLLGSQIDKSRLGSISKPSAFTF